MYIDKQRQFRQACENGDFETVNALINDPDVDPSVLPSADDNYAIRRAARNGYKEVVELLLTDERVMDKIDVAFEACKEYGGYELLKACVDEHKRELKQQEYEEKERRIQEAIEEMSADCELYF